MGASHGARTRGRRHDGAAAAPVAAPEQEEFGQAAAVRWGSRAAALLFGAAAVFLLVRHVDRNRGTFNPTVGDELVPLLLATLGFLFALAVAVFRPERLRLRGMVLTSAAWSLSLLLALAVVWYLIDVHDRYDPHIGTVVTDQAAVDAYLAAHLPTPAEQAAGETGPPYRVPTGFLIQSIEFSNANDVQISGFVWKKYAKSIPSDVPRGIVFPEAVVETVPASPSYTGTAADGSDLLGWRFHITLRQPFDYAHYPFDRQDVGLRVWAEDFDQRVVLVPDFDSYHDLTPQSLPGVGEDFVQAGWSLVHSHFSYGLNSDRATFGFPLASEVSDFPELYFSIGVKRSFLEPFLDDILFAAVVALLLFLVLCLTSHDSQIRSRVGISTFGVLGTTAGLLFSVILKDGQIRQAVATGEIVYIEVLPFLLYVTIILVAANALVLDSPLRFRFLDYRDNLLPDLLYWPALLGALLVITLVVFFV